MNLGKNFAVYAFFFCQRYGISKFLALEFYHNHSNIALNIGPVTLLVNKYIIRLTGLYVSRAHIRKSCIA